MAERPIFIPAKEAAGFVIEKTFTIPWASGFAPSQKQKNIRSLHAEAARAGFEPLLEISTKSEDKAGRHLSAFHLQVETDVGPVPLECAFQGSKVFEEGGPYTDLYLVDPREAKRDTRLQNSGSLIGFEFRGTRFPLFPKTVFYDWLYIGAVYPHREWLKNRLDGERIYAGFTDNEFNPSKSINCQARSCALFVALTQLNIIDAVVKSASDFVETMTYSLKASDLEKQKLFSGKAPAS